MQNEAGNWSLTCHLDFGGSGKVAVIRHRDGKTAVHAVPSASASGKAPGYRPMYIGVSQDGRGVLLMDPVSKVVSAADAMPADAAAHYAYPEAGTRRWWYSNDGDEKTGKCAVVDPTRITDPAQITATPRRWPWRRCSASA